jgi:NADH-quinone oxidoreductase subunit H
MISYEIPLALALLVVVVPAGTLSLQEMIRHQGGAPWNWFVFESPFTFIAFFVYFTSALAEGNRTPFDLPEAESELVAGYNTEYSGMRFLFFFFAEWMNLYVVGAVVTAVFLGGWRIPCIPVDRQAGNILLEFVGFVLFVAKSLTLVNVIIWLRWTLPRLRIDQLMKMCWKYFVPIGMVSLFCSMLFTALVVAVPLVGRLTSFALFGLGMLICAVFVWRTAYALRTFPAKPYLRWMV